MVPVASGLDTSSYGVYRLSPKGEMEKVSDVVLADGILRFETRYFADYVILMEAAAAELNQRTGLSVVVIVAAVAAVAGAAVYFLRKKK